MSAPTEERIIGGFRPEVGPVTFYPTDETAVSDALSMRRAIADLASHPTDIPPTAIVEAQIAVDDVVDATFVARKPTEYAPPPKHIAQAYQLMEHPTTVIDVTEQEPTKAYGLDIDLDIVDTIWKPVDPAEVEAAKEPIELDPVAATVAKTALEKVAEQNLASIDDDREAEEVVRAREALKDVFGEEAEVLPPRVPEEPDLPYVDHRRKLGVRAKLSLLLLFGSRGR